MLRGTRTVCGEVLAHSVAGAHPRKRLAGNLEKVMFSSLENAVAFCFSLEE
jgi:hypothetical protein